MKHYFIVNPAAGKGNLVEHFTALIHEVGSRRGLDYEIYQTHEVGDAARYVKEMCEREQQDRLRFYACGGDGTLGEVVNGAVHYENAEVATVPIGTGNDFVRNFGSRESFFDLENQIDSRATACDLLAVNGSYCVNMINIGFDSDVANRMTKMRRHPLVPSSLAYIFGVVGEFVKFRGVEFDCTIDGEFQGHRSLLLSLFANGGFCGGGFHAAPYAAMNDGKMDVCFIKRIHRLQFIGLIGSYKKGRHMLLKNCEDFCEYYKCSEVLLNFGKSREICIDGEIIETSTLHLKVMPGAIRFVLPSGIVSKDEPIPESPYVKVIE